MITQRDIDNAGNVIWGVADKLDGLQSPLAQELRDAWITLKAAVTPAVSEYPLFVSPSPNHSGKRMTTKGIIWHSTRGGAATPQIEFDATLRWFANPNSNVSAHFVIGHDRWASVVPDDLIAWHALSYNSEWIGVELVQQRENDPITDAQYEIARGLVVQLERRYGQLLHLEHRDIDPRKSDVGAPFELARVAG